MADPNPPSTPAAGAAADKASSSAPKPKPRNPALKMLGLPALPRKLPSRNWLIFWAITGSLTTAIIYDKREKNRATAKWRRAVEPLSRELISNPNQLPRKLTIYLEAPPGDGLRVAQDHFIEYVKPVLSASGLDWDFVQGRQQGDVRAAVAEKVRRARMAEERPGDELPQTDEMIVENLRKHMGLADYEGIKGDLVIGRHTWKEYIRGVHEGWLGPLDAPLLPESEPSIVETKPQADDAAKTVDDMTETNPEEDKEQKQDDKEVKKDDKPKRPPQPRPYNTTDDYSSAALPAQTPGEFSPSNLVPFPHRLGFMQTFVRIGWFLNRRKLADNIGREVAAVCFAASRDWREADGQYEQQLVLKGEEQDWPKSTWKVQDAEKSATDDDSPKPAEPPKERIWISDMVVDPRIAQRMRRFEITSEDAQRAAQIVVPEEEIEGWIKGSLRSMWRWGASALESKPTGPNVGNIDDE